MHVTMISPVRLISVEVKLNPCNLVALLAEHRPVRCALFARRQLLGLGLPLGVDDIHLLRHQFEDCERE